MYLEQNFHNFCALNCTNIKPTNICMSITNASCMNIEYDANRSLQALK